MTDKEKMQGGAFYNARDDALIKDREEGGSLLIAAQQQRVFRKP